MWIFHAVAWLQAWLTNEYYLLRGNAKDIAKCARAVGMLAKGLAAAVAYMVVVLAAVLGGVVVGIAQVVLAASPPPPPPPTSSPPPAARMGISATGATSATVTASTTTTSATAAVAAPPRPLAEWVFQDDSSRWRWFFFGAEINRLIEQAFHQLSILSAQGQTHTPQGPTATLRFEVKKEGDRTASYVVNFGTMTQTNEATGFKRAVRRLLAEGAPRPANVWEVNFTPLVCAYKD